MGIKRAIKNEWNYRQHRAKASRVCQRERRARAKEWGRCSICCKNKPEPGYKTCRECRIKISEYNYQRRLRRMKDGTDNSDNTQNGTLDGRQG